LGNYNTGFDRVDAWIFNAFQERKKYANLTSYPYWYGKIGSMNLFYSTISFPLAFTLLSCSGDSAKNRDKEITHPNILFISIDDLRPELGCYGNEHIISPHIDRLAEKGTMFTNHFVSVPNCGRAYRRNGRYTVYLGVKPNLPAGRQVGHDNLSALWWKKFLS
jgi:hypothetical protein